MQACARYTHRSNDWSLVRSNGRVDLPADFSTYKLGQRVYFYLNKTGQLSFGPAPKRCHQGRLLSCRIKRGLRSLAMYGPRS